jgi:hypothetical protein
MDTEFDIRGLVRFLGSQGAKAGLVESKLWTVEALKGAAGGLGLKFPDKATRKDMIEEIVRVANKRIDKPLEELYAMDFEQLKTYLDSAGAEAEELLELLKDLNLTPRREGRKNLIEFAARELSETGRFMRIAGTR